MGFSEILFLNLKIINYLCRVGKIKPDLLTTKPDIDIENMLYYALILIHILLCLKVLKKYFECTSALKEKYLESTLNALQHLKKITLKVLTPALKEMYFRSTYFST